MDVGAIVVMARGPIQLSDVAVGSDPYPILLMGGSSSRSSLPRRRHIHHLHCIQSLPQSQRLPVSAPSCKRQACWKKRGTLDEIMF
jgi:hypothetical protein